MRENSKYTSLKQSFNNIEWKKKTSAILWDIINHNLKIPKKYLKTMWFFLIRIIY